MSESERGNSVSTEVNPFTGQVEPGDTTEDLDTDASATQNDQEIEKTQEDTETTKEADVSPSEARLMVIDSIEREFNRLDAGKLSPEELAEYLKRPEIAEIADKSKRMKERYRDFIGKFDRGEYQKIREEDAGTTTKTEPQTEKERMLEYLREHDAQRERDLIERKLQEERNLQSEKFAAERGIKDEDFKRFEKTAKVLFETNEGWSYTDALDAANRALFRTKGSPTMVPSGTQSTVQVEKPGTERIDLGKEGYTELSEPSVWGL